MNVVAKSNDIVNFSTELQPPYICCHIYSAHIIGQEIEGLMSLHSLEILTCIP